MRKNTRTLRLMAAAMTLILAMTALVGCSAVVTDPVVAKVGDVEIKYSTFYNAFAQYAQYGIIDTSTALTAQEGRDMIMEMLVDSVVPMAQAKKEGLTLTDEETEAAKADALAMMDSYLDTYMDEAIEDEAERKAAAIKAFDAAYKAADLNYADLLVEMEKEYVDNALGSKLIAELYATVAEPTDEDIQARYDEELAADVEAYAADPSQYYNDDMYYSYYGNLRPLQAPEGLYYVKHILIKNAENADEEDKDRDYKALAQEVMDKVNAGEDFEALIAEYNEDQGMESNPEGYIIGADFEGVYDEAFQKAAAELKKEGDVSGLVEGSYGIHIIKRYGDVSTEPVALDEVKEDIKNLILSELQNELYTAKVAEWKESLDIVTYDKRVQYVGVNQ
ncbi:MAG: peptidylprolyl isomerase [Clostridia bacterium]|nr:peptidylprolyl isomerase [Clostridia bacterium]